MRSRVREWWRMEDTVAADVRDRLVLLQTQRLHEQLPFLAILIAANSIAMGLAVYGDLPLWQQLLPPTILVGSMAALLVWRSWAGVPTTPAQARRRIKAAARIAFPLGLVGGLWCVNAFNETEQYYCMVAPLFIAIAALVSASCLLSIPRAAIVAMVTVITPITLRMAAYPNLGVRSMAAMVVLVTIMQSRVVMAKFSDTVRSLSLRMELNRLADTDALTGLANRRGFLNCLDEATATRRDVDLLMLDLNGFKVVNDTFGHDAGDVLLTRVGERLRALVPHSLSMARLGGDEFAILVDAGEVDEAFVIRLRDDISRPYPKGPHQLIISTSVGVSRTSTDGFDSAALLRQADERLYDDKGQRRVQHVWLKTA